MNGIKIWAVIILIFVPFVLYSQSERWTYSYNGSADTTDGANSIIYGEDGNLYVAGSSTETNNSRDFRVISLTPNGVERWNYAYNGTADSSDGALSIVYGTDGNLYIAGLSMEGNYEYDFTVISLTTTGSERWVYTYNGSGNSTDVAYSIVYGEDGNLYVAGWSTGNSSGEDFTVISLTTDGSERWIYTYNGVENGDDEFNSIVYGTDGNIYAAGTAGGNSQEFTVISLTTSGSERWVYTNNGPNGLGAGANSIVYGLDGNLYSGGYTFVDLVEWYNFTVISLDTAGNERWAYMYNGSGDTIAMAYPIIYGSDGNIYAAGYTEGSGTYLDFTVIKVDTAGNEGWVYIYDGAGDDWDVAYSIVYGLDANLYVAGWISGDSSYDDFTVISLTTGGVERWTYIYNGNENLYDEALSIVYGLDGYLYIAGKIDGYDQCEGGDFFVVSLESETGVNKQEPLPSFQTTISYSSLFRNKIMLKLSKPLQVQSKIILYDICGKRVFEKIIHPTSNDIILKDKKIERLSTGVYFLSLTSGKITGRFKVLKLK